MTKLFILLFLFFIFKSYNSQKGINLISYGVVESNNIQRLLEDIMVKFLNPFNCITIVADPMHKTIFEKRWFAKFKSLISFIMINVEEYEDLFSPNKNTQESLFLSNKDGCQLYIILISNGIQVARLLQFGYRYRVIDTRVKYIMLYDSRLFEKSFHYLWKSIVNVVFLREYQGISGDLKKKAMPWFELITVPFPAPINLVLVPRRLDIWTQGRFRKGVDLFKDKTLDLKNQTLKIVTFPHTPGTAKDLILPDNTVRASLGNFTGAEVEILKTVANAMNFQCSVYEPQNAETELWGRKPQGSLYTGIIGEMFNSKADIALGDLYYTPYFLKLMDLSIPYNTECLTFLTPEALTDNSWKTLILPFRGLMWAGVIICLMICGVTFHVLARFHNHIEGLKDNDKNVDELHVKKKRIITLSMYPEIFRMDSNAKYTMMKERYVPPSKEGQARGLYQFTEPFNSLLYTYSMLLLVSLPKLPTGWSLRILTGWYWLYCLLLVVSYRASLTAILATPVPRVTIDTIQELIDSKLSFGGWGEINRDFFKSSLDPGIKEIGDVFEVVNNSDLGVDKVAAGTFAFYENTYFLKEAAVKRQLRYQSWRTNTSFNSTNSTENKNVNSLGIVQEDRSLHIMTDCIIKMPISIGLQKNSPIKPRVDKYIRKVLEAGLIKKWLNDAMQSILNAEIQTQQTVEIKALMNMRKFFGALVALFIGYFVGIVALIVEILYFKYSVSKDPKFNKFTKSCAIKKIK